MHAQVATTVHNIIVGKLWAEQHGTMLITNHSTGDVCELVYHPYSFFGSSEVPFLPDILYACV